MTAQAATVSYPDGSTANHESKWGMVKFGLTDTDVGTVSLTTEPIYGTIERITIDSNGTETDWSVELKDNIGLTLFSKTDCNSVLEPYGYAITEKDSIDPNINHRGIPVFSPLTLTASDVNDANEVQTLSVDAPATDGNFTLSYLGERTSNLAYDINAANVQAALLALSVLNTGEVSVSDGNLANEESFVFTFPKSLGNVELLVVDANLTGATASIVETKRGGSDLDARDITVYYQPFKRE
ncbi:MAG TPA: hypothetical protein DD726_02670 [Phycisphaerales bacterium]|nr:hypothetical protein [Phycisphaerales bacterium]